MRSLFDCLVVFVLFILVILGAKHCQQLKKLESRGGYCCCQDTRQAYLAEKRVDATLKVAAALARVQQHFFAHAGKKGGSDLAYIRANDEAVVTINGLLPVLGKEFDKQISLYIQIHRAAAGVGLENCWAYRGFFAAIECELDDVLHAAMTGEDMPKFTLEPIPYDKRIELSHKEYLSRQYQHWFTHRA